MEVKEISFMSLSKLSENEVQKNLKELNGWIILNGKLHKEIEFSDFDAAWNFMTIAVAEIQKMNPNVYEKFEKEIDIAFKEGRVDTRA